MKSGAFIVDEERINVDVVIHFTSSFKNQPPPNKKYASSFLGGVLLGFAETNETSPWLMTGLTRLCHLSKNLPLPQYRLKRRP